MSSKRVLNILVKEIKNNILDIERDLYTLEHTDVSWWTQKNLKFHKTKIDMTKKMLEKEENLFNIYKRAMLGKTGK